MAKGKKKDTVAAHAMAVYRVKAAREINLRYGQGKLMLEKNPLPKDRRLDGSPIPKKRAGEDHAVQ